ncbi:hypothetical protein KXV25_006790 [Aspergillus fumigatus]|nr:hypothetical protein KXV25_006790 [Aspergillus fumigatus]
MAHRRRKADYPSTDESGYSDGDSSDDMGYDTDPTELDEGEDQLRDASDVAQLFADNEHPPEYYIQQLENFDETVYTQEDYSEGTLLLLNRVEQKWFQFCACIRRDPQEEYLRLSIGILYTFLDWVLNLRRGKDGRRLPGIKRKSSLETFWKVFRLVYERATSSKIEKPMNRQMHRVIRKLAKKHKLSSKGREKSAMYVEDLAKVVETVISTTKKKFGHGRHRIELCLFLQLAGLTTNRPQAILDLKYRHIKVCLLRDPKGGPHRIVIEFTFEFTKEFLGAKDENTFILPEIIFDPSLILSPHVFLLGLLFADRAFARVDGEEVLMSAEQLLRLRIPDECNELQLTLDPALDNIPVFRQSERTLEGITISLDKALPYSTLLPWVKKVGAIAGFRQVSRPYSLRYGAGKALDNSGSVSDALRNLIMHHADTRTFLKYYLHRRIDKDLAAIIRGLDPQEDMMRAACRMSRTIDPKRPQELTTAQSSSVNKQPEIQDLIRRRGELRRQLGRPLARHHGTVKYEVYQKLNQELAGARQRARDALLAQLQEKYDREQPMLEIQRQLSGTKLAETVNQTLDYCEELPAPQKRLIETIFTLPRSTLEDEMRRRTDAIDAIAAYCLFEEGVTCRLARDKRPTGQMVEATKPEGYDVKDQETNAAESCSQSDQLLEAAIRSVMTERRPRVCFICVGQPNLDIKRRVKQFKEHGDLTKYIRRKHFKRAKMGDPFRCTVCGLQFTDKMHFQRHAIDIHSTVT